jgi:hypothetical protein
MKAAAEKNGLVGFRNILHVNPAKLTAHGRSNSSELLSWQDDRRGYESDHVHQSALAV